jgi:hypothetical protein
MRATRKINDRHSNKVLDEPASPTINLQSVTKQEMLMSRRFFFLVLSIATIATGATDRLKNKFFNDFFCEPQRSLPLDAKRFFSLSAGQGALGTGIRNSNGSDSKKVLDSLPFFLKQTEVPSCAICCSRIRHAEAKCRRE